MRIILLILCLPLAVWAQDYDLKTKPHVRVKKDRELKSKSTGSNTTGYLGRIGSPLKWGGEVGYSLRTDLADQIKPRLYTHSLTLAYGFEYVPTHISLTGVIDAAYESTGERRSEILVDDDRKELFLNDFTLALDKTIAGAWKSKFALGLANEFPSSPEAQRENYESVTSVSAGWSVPLPDKRLRLGLKGEAYYIWNRYRYSPASGELNKQGGGRAEISARSTLWQGWYVSAMAGSQISRFLDGTSDVTYRNAVGTGYAWPRFSVSLSMSNGTYLDREDTGVWFVDEYRRMLSFGMRLSF